MSSRAIRKLQNDEDLLESILAKNSVSNDDINATQTRHTIKQKNIFQFMNMDDDDDDDDSNDSDDSIRSTKIELEKPIEKPLIKLATKSQKKKNKKKQKAKKQQLDSNSKIDDNDNFNDVDDDDLDKLLLEFKQNDYKNSKLRKNNNNNNNNSNNVHDDDEEFFTASESEDETEDYDNYINPQLINNSILNDNYFSKFPIKYLRETTDFFNQDMKKLDAHTEFKLLFNDLSAESLDDIDSMSSVSISPQQLKQIQRLRKMVRNWDGKDHRSVPNGPGGSIRRLQFTKIRQDWLPTPRGELNLKSLNKQDLIDWQLWQRPNDWKDVVESDLKKWSNFIKFYKFEPINLDTNRKAMTEFYMNIITHPDHEALINLISSQFPYYVPGLLQVALITIRQGDNSNTNGLLQRALFVFDRALRNVDCFNSVNFQLPYIYFYNRQFYLTIFRYILALAQRGAMITASEWAKTLWSLSPLEDPLGVRYFIDHYLLSCNDYQTIIKMSKSPLMNTYQEWYTWGFSMATVLSYLKLDDEKSAKLELLKCFKQHSTKLAKLFIEKLAGDANLAEKFLNEVSVSVAIEYKAYLVRFSLAWKEVSHLTFLHNELKNLLKQYADGRIELAEAIKIECDDIDNVFFVNSIPVNLLRFVVLSEENSVMALIPNEIWSQYELYEFDVLPPTSYSRETENTVESVKSFINQNDLVNAEAMRYQDEDIMNQIRQLSLNQYIQQNETNQNND